MPRVRAELMDQGIAVSRKRVARLMRRASIRGVSRRRGFVVTTRRDANNKTAPDLEKRQFSANGPNRLWVAGMTYVPTWAGFILLAVVLDVWSRRIVGLGHRRTHDRRSGNRGAEHGARAAQAQGTGRSPQRPGPPVHCH